MKELIARVKAAVIEMEEAWAALEGERDAKEPVVPDAPAPEAEVAAPVVDTVEPQTHE